MKKVTLIVRVLLGLLFLVSGLNGFFHFMPMPPMEGKALAFMTGLMESGYFMPLLMGVETVCGLLLVVGAFVPLAIVALAPVILNIFLYHVFVDTKGLPMAVIIGLVEIYLAFFSQPYSPIVKQIFRCPMKEAMDAKKSQSA